MKILSLKNLDIRNTNNIVKIQHPYINNKFYLYDTSNKAILNLDSYKKNNTKNFNKILVLNSINLKQNKDQPLLKLLSKDSFTIQSKISLLKTVSKFSNNNKGLLIKFAGRLRGAPRAKKLKVNSGRISTQTFNATLLLNKKHIYTK
jgi:hypothetical protein